MTDDLGTQVEALDWLKADGYLGLGPFALSSYQYTAIQHSYGVVSCGFKTYASELVTLDLLLIAAAESSFVNQVRQFLLHHLLNLLDRSVQASLRGAGDMEI